MSVDSYYSRGRMHPVCQDYALHGLLDNGEYVIISDGCSSSEFKENGRTLPEFTELGAQILCHVTRGELVLYSHAGVLNECTIGTLSSLLGNSIYKKASQIVRMLGRSKTTLEATLLIAIRVGTTHFVLGWGDGVVIWNYLDETGVPKQYVLEINYPLNAPFYLISDPEIYRENCKKENVPDPQVSHVYHDIYGGDVKSHEVTIPFYEPLKLNDPFDLSFGKLISITVCSDGVKSYVDKSREDVELKHIIPGLIGFKNTTGEFVKKRMHFFEKEMKKKEWTHYDDISCGTIYLD